ncbi:Protein BNI4 [Colletotrichum sp. SAR 10_71]|nr:Protein BNI4 [Colletotrichum sp. SAR 10_71]KAI8208508.1 Protein BNI4 [Colletotrichum sp. SAR 10_76]KAJ5000364.1 Protein BNI4 [Colletotrichum sp. SAR 10_66]
MMPAQAQANQQYMAAQQAQRNFSGASGVYRGSNAPIQPYAFTSTPSLNTTGQWQQYGNGYRTASSPAVPTQGMVQGHDGNRSRHTGSSSVSYSHNMGTSQGGSRDDSAIPAARTNPQAQRPQSAYLAGSTTPQMTFAQAAGAKTTPDRYRRPALQQQQPRQTSAPSGSGMATSANRSVPTPTANPSLSSSSSTPDDASSKHDQLKIVNIPPRNSSSDAAKRQPTPSPLSKPVTMSTESSPQKPPSSLGNAPQQAASNANASSPAAQQLAAIKQNGTKSKSKTSRLRRAFSFGSAADFKKAAGPEPPVEPSNVNAGDASKLHKDPTADELYEAEQAAIAKKQEEGGIGSNIYGGRLFSGSTDNLSISSTASSASIMIRKMGRGMKKSTRSLVGLFRPKSVIGVPAADAMAPEASQAAVSMITVEAERVNVNPDPRAQNGGGTGFPHLERNSLDVSNTPSMVSERAGSSGTDSAGRKSIVGGDRERAEVLAAVRKGILKHNGRSNSPARDGAKPFELPAIPNVSDSPISTAPSTPNDEAQGHKRSGSVAIGSEDYFMTALRLRQDSKSAPGTPSGGTKRNATFSPRIVFHDTWPSGEYDRRGEIATCNRLTPMLAQQIKEELNTFKMEMEVHENSKIYTHFF